MQKYFNNVISASGIPVQGASVQVLNYSSNSVATIYSDDGVTTTTNPLTTDAWGQFSFYAADGRYTFVVTANGVVGYTFTDVLVDDPLVSGIITNTAATYTVLTTDQTIVQTTVASVYTLPSAASFTGRKLHIVTQFAGAVTSVTSDVVPLAGGAANTAILAATAGKFATLQSNGTYWLTIAAN